jgi:hypothetical protein
MTEFMRPQVKEEPVNETFSRFIVEPLERGYGGFGRQYSRFSAWLWA